MSNPSLWAVKLVLYIESMREGRRGRQMASIGDGWILIYICKEKYKKLLFFFWNFPSHTTTKWWINMNRPFYIHYNIYYTCITCNNTECVQFFFSFKTCLSWYNFDYDIDNMYIYYISLSYISSTHQVFFLIIQSSLLMEVKHKRSERQTQEF